ncbi:MAG: ATP-binding protein [Candidatus Sumerlaeia bacterium]|nr:ATP-binding protein [Candidatus Sumerlaeia bacterium]
MFLRIPAWSPSLRAKIFFFGLACLLMLALGLTLVTVFAVEARKRQIVGRARELVQQHVEHLASVLEEEAGEGAAALRDSPKFRQALRFVLGHDNRVVVFLTVDEKGRVTYQLGPEQASDVRLESAAPATSEAASARRPILRGGQARGDIEVKYVPEVLLGEIQRESRQITAWLSALAGGISALLVATFWFLWHIFRRHLERERAHEKLDRMAYVGTLAAGLAHEIRNPLNALSLNLDVVGEEIADPRPDSGKRTGRILELLKSEVRRLNTTLTNFLQFALPPPAQIQTLDVVAVLSETAAVLEPEMRRRHVHYRFEGDRSCLLEGDPSALQQVFWNVMLNAIQAMENRPERRLVAACRAEGNVCQIEIRDTGPGIPVERREQVFEVFYSTRPGGSGFGLAIARQIVQRHGGSIVVDSRNGWACIIRIVLPLRMREKSPGV